MTTDTKTSPKIWLSHTPNIALIPREDPPSPPLPTEPPLVPGGAPSGSPGGSPPWSMELTPWDYWSQTADPDIAGGVGSGINAQNNCGPECIAMSIVHLTDVVLDASYIKDYMHGPNYTGYTSLEDQVKALHYLARTDAHILWPNTKDRWLWTIWKALTLRHPLIGLYYFSAPGAPDGHFRCITGMGSREEIVTADPANGTRRIEPWDTQWQWAQGPLIEINRRRPPLS